MTCAIGEIPRAEAFGNWSDHHELVGGKEIIGML